MMKKILVPLLLCLATIGTASARWSYVAESPDGSYYVDVDSARSNGRYVEAWQLFDNKKMMRVDGTTIDYRSNKGRWRFDCATYSAQVLETAYYSGNMGKGDITGGDTTTNDVMRRYNPKSIAGLVMNMVCRR